MPELIAAFDAFMQAPNLMMLHMLLDDLLTLVIVQRMDSQADDGGLLFERRVRLALDAGWIPRTLARDLRATNRLRTALLHFGPLRARRRLSPEIPSREAFVHLHPGAGSSARRRGPR